MKKLLKLAIISLVILIQNNAIIPGDAAASITSTVTCKGPFFGDIPNANAIIAYIQGYSKYNNFLYSEQTTPSSLDLCVYNAIKSEANKINTCYFGNSIFIDGVMGYNINGCSKERLASPTNWPTQTKLNIASAINRQCGSPYTQFDYTSSTFSNFLNTYINAMATVLKPFLSC